MTENERKLALYCLKASSDYHSEVCEECINYPNCDHTIQDDVTETIIKALEQTDGDLISRQSVLDLCGNKEWLEEYHTEENGVKTKGYDILKMINYSKLLKLPSAESEEEE